VYRSNCSSSSRREEEALEGEGSAECSRQRARRRAGCWDWGAPRRSADPEPTVAVDPHEDLEQEDPEEEPAVQPAAAVELEEVPEELTSISPPPLPPLPTLTLKPPARRRTWHRRRTTRSLQ